MAHLLLIDGLNLVRRLYAAQERPFLHSATPYSAATGEQLLFNTSEQALLVLKKLVRQFEPSHLALVFEQPHLNWRARLYPPYKADRHPMPEHLQLALPALQQRLQDNGFSSVQLPEQEADDLIASLAMQMRQHQQQATIVSTDKGYLQLLPSGVQLYDHFNRVQHNATTVLQKFGVLPEQLVRYWSLVGDKTNNISGIAGIGPKTAAELLQLGADIKTALSHPDCPEKLKQKILAAKAELMIFMQILSLKTDLRLGLNLQQFRYSPQRAD
ncbi:flap endonuclease Xni [Rheinheimera sp.]|uniref:flap endonuclease Xni n=1 Tax=Rheinheimera sp. TaxID=1869214 RepID=UPI00307CDF70